MSYLAGSVRSPEVRCLNGQGACRAAHFQLAASGMAHHLRWRNQLRRGISPKRVAHSSQNLAIKALDTNWRISAAVTFGLLGHPLWCVLCHNSNLVSAAISGTENVRPSHQGTALRNELLDYLATP